LVDEAQVEFDGIAEKTILDPGFPRETGQSLPSHEAARTE